MGDVSNVARFFEATPSAVLVTDADGRVQYVNPQFTKLTGFAHADVVGEHFGLFARPTPEQEEEAWSVLSRGKSWRGAGQGQRRDGTRFKAFVAVSPVKSPEGEVTHFLALAANLTEGRHGWDSGNGRASDDNALTRRETEVLRLVAQGFTDLEISERLTVSVRTVNRHVSVVLRKLGAANRTRAVYLAKDLLDTPRRGAGR